jgi:ATP-binding cassette subfamily B protein
MSPVREKRDLGVTSMDVLRFAWSYWIKQPARFGIIMSMLLVSTLVEAALPNGLSAFFEAIRLHQGQQAVLAKLGIFLGAYCAYNLLFTSACKNYNVFENKVFHQLLDDAFKHVQTLSEQFFVNTFAGSLITTIKRGRDRIETFEDQILLKLIPTSVILVASLAMLAVKFPVMAAVLGVYSIMLIAATALLIDRYAGPAQAKFATAQDIFGAHLADAMTGIVTTKSYAQEEREIERFTDMTASLHDKNLDAYLRGNTAWMIQRMLLLGMLAVLLGGGTWYFFQGLATIDDMAYLLLAYTILQSHISEVGNSIKSLMTAAYDLHAVIALMRHRPVVADKPNAKHLVVSEGDIRFNEVSFTYPGKDKPAFSGLNIHIRPGERVALVGRSGSGKTTFVRLLQRLYDIESGAIEIDGQRIDECTQSSLRSSIAVVPQEPILFHRSLHENIAYGNAGATLEDVRSAAQKACIDDFIMSLPQQYETLVGERGIKLSGGERQRVAIARAILSDRPILILDEATSSLDSQNEHAIQDAIHAVSEGRSSIIIAHRLSTIRDADRIIVFQDGEIVEEGDHDDLLGREVSLYADFYRMQSDGFVEPAMS